MKMKLLLIICCIYLLLVPLIGCKATDPVEIIQVFKTKSANPLPPTGGWGISDGPINPYPEGIQQVFSIGDRLFIGLRISNEIKTNVIFSKFTYYNKVTSIEVEVGFPSDTMKVWEPGQVDLLALNNPWSIPSGTGDYQLRVYLDNKIVASANFQVKIEASPTSVTSQCQAVNIAKENIPSSIIPKITASGAATNPENQWFVDFVFLGKNKLVNRQEILDQNFQIDEGDTFNLIIIYINEQTGIVVKKMAKNGIVPGNPTFWVNCNN